MGARRAYEQPTDTAAKKAAQEDGEEVRLRNLPPLPVGDRIEEPFVGIRERLNAQGAELMTAPRVEGTTNDFLESISRVIDAMPIQSGPVVLAMSDEAYQGMRLAVRYIMRRDRKKRMSRHRRM